MQAADFHVPFPTSRGYLKAIAYAQSARGERSGNHGARAFHAKGAVHPQAHGCLCIGNGHSGQDLIERLPQRRNAVAGRSGYGDNGGVGKRGAGQLRSDFCGAVHGGAIAASERNNAVLYSQRTQGIAVVGGLGLPSLIGRNHKEDHRGWAHASEHIA